MTSSKPSAQPRHPNWTIAATMLASSLAFIDGSVTNVALSTIGKDVHSGAADLSWIINAYMLPLSALLLFGGEAGDHFGRRRALIGGITLFAIASVGCALAGGLEMLLAFRALQGLGAALLMPNSLGILGSSFEGEARGRAVGTWAAAGAIASAIGPPLGGWLVDTVGWRSIFTLNIPVAAAAIAAAWAYADESEANDGGLDWAGALLATAVLSSVDARHTGTASGFNSAVARTGGLIATALSGAVIATSGAALVAAYHWSALVAAVLAISAGLTAFATLDRKS